MPVTRGGAREVLQKNPLLETLKETGDALGRMGQLFNQTRQIRAYEQQIAMENANRFMEQAQNVYARYAEATDPARAWNDLGDMLRSGLAAYGIDANEIKSAFQKIGQIPLEEMNPMVILSRAWVRSKTGKGLPFDQAVAEVIGEEQQRMQKEQAAATGEVSPQPRPSAPPASTPSPLQQQEEGLHVRYGQLEAAAPEEPVPAPTEPGAAAVPSPEPVSGTPTSLSLAGFRALKEAAPEIGEQIWGKIKRNAEVAGGQIQTEYEDLLKKASSGQSVLAGLSRLLLLLYRAKKLAPEDIVP